MNFKKLMLRTFLNFNFRQTHTDRHQELAYESQQWGQSKKFNAAMQFPACIVV